MLGKGKESHYHALIMAGGKGERFWPWSREKRPKQLLPLFGKKTMIEMTIDRLLPLIPRDRIWIITNATQARAMQKLMPKFPKSNFIVEPVGRDSAGAVMLGCASIASIDPEAVMALLPADALIKDQAKYLKVLKSCFETAQRDQSFVTIGIKPTEPSSAYGYIERAEKVRNSNSASTAIYRAKRFIEKPSVEKAQKLLKTRRYYWNSGMFIWSASAIYEGFKKYSPVHARGWEAIQRNCSKYLKTDFLKLEKISIDYAVMEKAKNIYVAEGVFDWDDVGSWSSMSRHMPSDEKGNAHRGSIVSVDSNNCLVLGNDRTIATLGVSDLVIVQTEDATLVCHRNKAQNVKEIVKLLDPKLK